MFAELGLQVESTNFDQALALEKLKSGEISAMVFVAGKPTDLFRRIEAGTGLHFLPVPLSADFVAHIPAVLADPC